MPNSTPLILGFPGQKMNAALRRHLLDCRPVGVALFQRNIVSLEQTARLIKEIRAILGPIFVSIDHEGGLVNRFSDLAPVPPSAYALGRSGRIELARMAGHQQAGLLAHLGINMNFAPCLDLYHQESPVIGTRAFSAHPDEVARFGLAVMEEHLKMGVIPVGKHFCGHGRSRTDSHVDNGQVNVARSGLDRMELKPFQLAIDQGLPAIMTAHLHFPQLDPGHPASLSKSILTDLLREEMGFQGVVISDCLEMAATSRGYSHKQMVQLGQWAGLDLWLSSYSLKESLSFQKDLALALRRHQPGPLKQHVQSLLERAQNPQGQPASWGENHRLWEACLSANGTLEKIKAKKLHILELRPPIAQGITQGEAAHPLQTMLEQSSLPIASYQRLNHCLQIGEGVQLANHAGAAILLISHHPLKNAKKDLAALKDAKESIHLSLTHQSNLTQTNQREYCLHGYNASGGRFITKMLESLCQNS